MRTRRTTLRKWLAWLNSAPHLVGLIGGVAGIAFSVTYILTVLSGGDSKIVPNVPPVLVRGEPINIIGENLDLVSRVQLSREGNEEIVFLMAGNKSRLTIVVPNSVVPGDYALEFIKQGKDDPVASGNTSVIPADSNEESVDSQDDLIELKFAGLSWKSAQKQNAIARKIIEEGYGHETSTVFGAIPRLWDSLFDGSIHVMMEVWLPNYQKWWDQGLRDGSIIPLGKSLDENWQSSFVIPTYLAEENPGLRSVSDLPEFAHLFATRSTARKALLNACVEDWVCSEINKAQVKAYGLEDTVAVVHADSEGRLFGSLQEAYDRGEAWIGFVWGPTKIAEDLDLTVLEEPPYTKICWDTNKACAFPTSRVRIAVHPSLIARAPDVMEFLRRWDLDSDTQIAIEDYFETTNEDYEATATWFLRNHEIIWVRWVPPDVFEKVKAEVEP